MNDPGQGGERGVVGLMEDEGAAHDHRRFPCAPVPDVALEKVTGSEG